MDAVALTHALSSYVEQTCGATRVTVPWAGIDAARLGEGASLSFAGDPCVAHPVLRMAWTDAGHRVSLAVRPEIAGWVSVPVVDGDALRGDVVRVRTGEAPLGTLAASLPVGRAVRASRDLHDGEPLTAGLVEPMPDADAGAQVVVVARSGGLEIRAPGRLIAASQVGEPTRVANLATGVVLRGVLVAPDVVEVGR
jgi:flagella basal body P-ring formation protein FlgA